MLLRLYKSISSLPSTLERNSLYFVRNGTGFDLYCTEMTGNVAYKINTGEINYLDGGSASSIYSDYDSNIDCGGA